jgi:excisionase family DNA binding protein
MSDQLAVDYDDAADKLGISSRSVRRLVRSRELPAVKITGQPRIRTADLVEYVAGLDPIGDDSNGESE